MGTHFYELDVERMTSDMIEWKFDYVRIDTSDIPLYLRDLNEIVNLTDIDLPHSLSDLSRDELIALRRQIQIGSMYLSDFNNDYFIDRDELCAESESFLDSQMEKYGADEYESHLTPEEFADHFFQA